MAESALQRLLRQQQQGQMRPHNTTLSSRPPSNTITGSGPTPTPTADERRQGALDPSVTVDVNNWLPQNQAPAQQRATDAVSLEYDERLRALQRASDRTGRSYDQAINTEREYGREVDPRLENIYGALGNSLQMNAGANQQTYDNAINRIRSFYDEAGQANQGMNQSIIDRINTDATRLGIEAAIPAATQGVNSDFQFLQGLNTNAKAGRSANLAQLAAQIGVADNDRIGASAQEGAQQRATLQNEIAKTLGNLGVAGFNELGEYRGQMAGLEQDRATAIRDELARLTQQDFENNTEGRRNALDEFMQRSGLNMAEAGYRRDIYTDNRNFNRGAYEDTRDFNREGRQYEQEFTRGNYESDRNYGLARDQFALDRSSTAFQQQLQRDELNMRRSQLQAELAQANSPEQRRLIQQEIQRNDLEIQRMQNPGAAGQQEYPRGQIGLEQFLAQPRPEWGQNGAGPIFRQRVQDIIREALSLSTDPVNPMDPYTAAIGLIDVRGGQMDKNLLQQALQVWFQGV